MALLDMLAGELLGPKSVGELSKSADADGDQTKQLVTKALPLLLSGMYQNSATDEGAQSLDRALETHAPAAQKSTSAMLRSADINDGKKIVKHVLGDNEEEVRKGLSESTGLTQPQVSTMLGQLAPVVLSLVGNFKKEENGDKEQKDAQSLISVLGFALLGKEYGQVQSDKKKGLNLTSLIGSLLGGSSSGDSKKEDSKKESSGAGALLGNLLGGSSGSQKQEGGVNLSGLLMSLLK